MSTVHQPLRFLDPHALSSIASLELLARTVVQGFVSGLHRSPYLGFSLDFAEYQQYRQGDDVRRIDWKVYGRSDRLYIKKFRGDTNARCFILLDCSRSMGFSSGALSKFDYGRYLAACLTYFVTHQQDLVGFAAFDTQMLEYIGPRGHQGHLQLVLRSIENLELGRQTSMGEPLHQLAERLYRRGMVVVISDLLDDSTALMDGIKHLRYQGQDCILFHILDDSELTFPYQDMLTFVDLETDQQMEIQPRLVKKEYLEALNRHNDYVMRECILHGIDYQLLNTAMPLDFALYSYLSRRSKARLGKERLR
jgi:uncharacterized protein (DUF58 family)